MKHVAHLLAAISMLTACDRQPTTPESAGTFDLRAASVRGLSADVNKELAALRNATAAFHNFATASNAGWSAQITPCMTDPAGAGGMGFHYGNPALIDGTARVEEPELLLYEPDRSGRLRLVAVEYIIPYTEHSRDATAPELFGGRKFKQNDTFQLWGLHAWVWNDNPSGMFADWNPRVTCEHTSSVSRMAH
jgi:hypothetical protein